MYVMLAEAIIVSFNCQFVHDPIDGTMRYDKISYKRQKVPSIQVEQHQ